MVFTKIACLAKIACVYIGDLQTMKRATTPLKRTVQFRATNEPYCSKNKTYRSQSVPFRSQNEPYRSQNEPYRVKSCKKICARPASKWTKKAYRTVQ